MAISAPLMKLDSSDARNKTRSAHSFGVPCRCNGIAVREAFAAAAIEAGVGDLPGMDRIDPDVPLRELQHRRLGQAAQSPFAGGVGGIVMRRQPRGPGKIYDRPAAAVTDCRRAVLYSPHRPRQIYPPCPVPRLD